MCVAALRSLFGAQSLNRAYPNYLSLVDWGNALPGQVSFKHWVDIHAELSHVQALNSLLIPAAPQLSGHEEEVTAMQRIVLSSPCIAVLLGALQTAESAWCENNGTSTAHAPALLYHLVQDVANDRKVLIELSYEVAELAAMRSLYAAVQLLISRLLDFVIQTQKASTAESESSAASMSRDRASGVLPNTATAADGILSLRCLSNDGCPKQPVYTLIHRTRVFPVASPSWWSPLV